MTFFISEVSSNHAQDLERCLRFIDVSSEVGCDAVKFQLFKVDRLFSPEAIRSNPSLEDRKRWELPVHYLSALKERCTARGLSFSCTPFYLEAVEELDPHVDFFKVASYELMWDELLERCARTGKPLVLSTGMATLEEIEHAVAVCRDAKCKKLTLLHCVSGYPTPPGEANLAAIESLRKRFDCDVGWSDHTVNPSVVGRAIHRWNVSTVEFHLDLDGDGAEYTSGHCWLPEQIAPVIRDARLAVEIDGSDSKKIAPSEASDRDWRADPSDGLRPLRKVRVHLGK